MSDTPETMGGLSGSTNCAPAIEHNRAKPMSELASALFLIADANEFRFARFNIVYEGAQVSAAQKSYELSRGVRTCPTGVIQTWKDTDHRRCSHRLVRNATFFEQNVP